MISTENTHIEVKRLRCPRCNTTKSWRMISYLDAVSTEEYFWIQESDIGRWKRPVNDVDVLLPPQRLEIPGFDRPIHRRENPDTFSLLGTPISYKVTHFTTD